MSVSLDVEWGGTGDAEVGAESFSVLTPTFFVGKGFGDLREGADYVRAFAVTGQVGYAVPTESSTTQIDPVTGLPVDVNNPDFLVYGGSLQYSFPYLKANVVDLGLPEFINHLIPLVEVRLQTPVNNNEGTGIGTTGTVNPGVIYLAQYFQVGLEAIIPVNRESGTDVGVMGQLHLFLDDIFPQTLGKPLFSSAGGPGRASGT
jgi:hypothetical protein